MPEFPLPLTTRAIDYAWRQLAYRIGITDRDLVGTGFERMPLSVCYGQLDQMQRVQAGIIVIPCAQETWRNLLEKTDHSLDWLLQDRVLPISTALRFSDPILVLFWGAGYEDGHKPFAERRADGSVVFYADIIAATLFMLTRWEETVIPDRDEHGRFPATASVAYKQGFLDRPIVDEYALILREWIKVLLPGWEPKPRPFSVKLSHDIDQVRHITGPVSAVRMLAGDIIKRRNADQAWNTLQDIACLPFSPAQNLYFRRIFFLAELSRRYKMNSAFYFLAVRHADPFQRRIGYDPSLTWIKQGIQDLQENGFEIGLHASYNTLGNAQLLAAEKAKLDQVFGHSRYGGRQHYLRFEAPTTWRHWEEVGLAYDSTVGYADCEGFRCGTAHPFHPFDIEQDRELRIWEWPLIAMDGTLMQYRQLSSMEGYQRIIDLAYRCKTVEGTLTLLWHNTSLDHEWLPWLDTYYRTIKKLSALCTN